MSDSPTDEVRAGVRSKEELVPVTIKLPKSTVEEIDRLRVSRSTFLRQAALDALERNGLSAWASAWKIKSKSKK